MYNVYIFLTCLYTCRYKELEGVVVIGATNFPESLDKYAQVLNTIHTHVYIFCISQVVQYIVV